MTDLSTTLASFRARAVPAPGAANENSSAQIAIHGLTWALLMMSQRLSAQTVLHAVDEVLYMAEQLPDVDVSGLQELREKLVAESRV